MKINRIELNIYLILMISVMILSILPALLVDSPNLDPPPNMDNEQPEQESQRTQREPFNIPGFNLSGILQILIVILIILVISLIFLNFNNIRNFFDNLRFKSESREEKVEENVRKVKDARTVAYKIIEQGLRNQIYTESFIEAYQALDASLDYFREISRPKYWTPKEYSFNVSKPIFQPSVYLFVNIFYDLRYGFRNAKREDLLQFKESLDYLFINEVPQTIKEEWSEIIGEELRRKYSYKIQRNNDLSRPDGGI